MASGTIKMPGWRLLWTNPNPTTEFSPQTITLNDLGNYSKMRVVCYAAASGIELSPFDFDTSNGRKWTYAIQCTNSVSDIMFREFSKNGNSLTFLDAFLYQTIANGRMIPMKIFAR